MGLAMLAAGAMSGVTHCAAMCGPLVLAQVASLPPEPARCAQIAAGARLPYHLGRLTSYAALGAIAGAAGRALVRSLEAEAAPVALVLAIAALFVALSGLWRGNVRQSPIGQRIAWLARPLLGKGALAGYGLGLVLGLLPCGMIYAALSVAAASASPLVGASLMAAFAIGTMPGLIAIGTVGRTIGSRLGLRLAPLSLGLNAVILGMLALRAWMAG